MVTVNDSKLADLSSRYQQPLLRVTERSARSISLLILLSILPALIAFPLRTINEENASFGLQCLNVFRETPSKEFLEMENFESTWHSPFAVWLTAAVTGKLRILHFEGMMLISATATAIFLILTFLLVKSLLGHRLAFWSLVFLVTHPLVVSIAVRPAPLAVGLAFSVSGLLLYLKHLRQSRKLLSYNVLFAGISFGGVLLTSGLLSVLHILLIISMSLLSSRTTEENQSSFSINWSSLRTAGVLMLTAFAVSGWWIMQSAINRGNAFWGKWISGISENYLKAGSQNGTQYNPSSLGSGWAEFFTLSGLMTGLFFVGLWILFLRAFIKSKKIKVATSDAAFLFLWFGLALACWILSQTVSHTSTWAFSTSSAALLIPLSIFAAYCVTEFTDRNLGLGWVVIVWELGVLVVFSFRHTKLIEFSAESSFYWSPVIAVSIVLFSYCVVRICRHRFRLANTLIIFALLSFPIYNISQSWTRVNLSSKDSKTLRDFRVKIEGLADVENIVVSSSDAIPLALKYSLRSRWPDAEWLVENHLQAKNLANHSRTLLIRWEKIKSNEIPVGLQTFTRFHPVTDSVLYRQRELRAYFVD